VYDILIWIINFDEKARSHFLSHKLFIFIFCNRVVIKSPPFISILSALALEDWMVSWFIFFVYISSSSQNLELVFFLVLLGWIIFFINFCGFFILKPLFGEWGSNSASIERLVHILGEQKLHMVSELIWSSSKPNHFFIPLPWTLVHPWPPLVIAYECRRSALTGRWRLCMR